MGKCIQVLSQSLKYGILYGMLFPLREESLCFVFLLDLRLQHGQTKCVTKLQKQFWSLSSKSRRLRAYGLFIYWTEMSKEGFTQRGERVAQMYQVTWACLSNAILNWSIPSDFKNVDERRSITGQESGKSCFINCCGFEPDDLFCPFFQPACVWICAL